MKNSIILIGVIVTLVVGVGAWYLFGSDSDDHHVDNAGHAAMEGADAMH